MRSSRSAPDPLDPGPAGFVHRGLHGPDAPENSIAAFRAALDARAGIECDVRLSGDGEAMVFHDHNLKRLCGSALVVERTPAALLIGQRLLGTSEPIPRLFDVLELVGGRVALLIELKTCDNASKLVDAVASDLLRYGGRVAVMSLDPRIPRLLKTNVPLMRRGLVVRSDLPHWRRRLAMWLADPHFIAVEQMALGQSWVARARRQIPVYSWTIATAQQRAQAEVQADALIWEGDGRPRI